MAEAAELRRARGQAKGQITRAIASLTHWKTLALKDRVLDKVQKVADMVEKADGAFHDAQDRLRALDDDGSQEVNLLKEDTDHFAPMSIVEGLLEPVLAQCHSYQLGTRLMVALEALKVDLDAGYLPAFAAQFSEIEDTLRSYRNWTLRGGSMEVEELKELSGQVNHRWTLVGRIRASSGYSSDPLLVGAPSAPVASSSIAKLKVKVPVFDGVPEHWQDFKTLFLDIMKGEHALTSEAAKKAIFIDAVEEPAAKSRLSGMATGDIKFLDVLAKFGSTYEDPREMISLHLNRLLQIQSVGCNKPDIDRMIDTLEEGISGLTAASSFTAEQLVAAYMDGKMVPALRKDWRNKTGDCSSPPTTVQLLAFLRA